MTPIKRGTARRLRLRLPKNEPCDCTLPGLTVEQAAQVLVDAVRPRAEWRASLGLDGTA